jgi:hypothetical protein
VLYNKDVNNTHNNLHKFRRKVTYEEREKPAWLYWNISDTYEIMSLSILEYIM